MLPIRKTELNPEADLTTDHAEACLHSIPAQPPLLKILTCPGNTGHDSLLIAFQNYQLNQESHLTRALGSNTSLIPLRDAGEGWLQPDIVSLTLSERCFQSCNVLNQFLELSNWCCQVPDYSSKFIKGQVSTAHCSPAMASFIFLPSTFSSKATGGVTSQPRECQHWSAELRLRQTGDCQCALGVRCYLRVNLCRPHQPTPILRRLFLGLAPSYNCHTPQPELTLTQPRYLLLATWVSTVSQQKSLGRENSSHIRLHTVWGRQVHPRAFQLV